MVERLLVPIKVTRKNYLVEFPNSNNADDPGLKGRVQDKTEEGVSVRLQLGTEHGRAHLRMVVDPSTEVCIGTRKTFHVHGSFLRRSPLVPGVEPDSTPQKKGSNTLVPGVR